MPSGTLVRIIVGLAFLLMLALSTVTGQSIDREGYKWITGVAGVIGLLLLIYDRWAWRWPVFWVIAEKLGRPVLHGTWRGELFFEDDREVGRQGPIECYVTIWQTFSRVEVAGYFRTSESHSTSTRFETPRAGQRLLWYTYRSEAPVLGLKDNRPHSGACRMTLVGRPVGRMTGSYWTDRRGHGEIALEGRSRECYDSFESAKTGVFGGRRGWYELG